MLQPSSYELRLWNVCLGEWLRSYLRFQDGQSLRGFT